MGILFLKYIRKCLYGVAPSCLKDLIKLFDYAKRGSGQLAPLIFDFFIGSDFFQYTDVLRGTENTGINFDGLEPELFTGI